ncbi:hypothetical protein VTJ49DRAFT_3428 [Mycothermus thermophilus]|uniref:Metalloprotease n=1 Tax=Humicola insolens TaxID=85995 RepID=A0ABR3V7J8_HUMIN
MRREFPPIQMDHMPDAYAALVRGGWAKKGATLEMYSPRESYTVKVNNEIMTKLKDTKDNEDRDAYTFLMIVSITHEVAHALMNFLEGYGYGKTPVQASAPGTARSEKEGECGFAWELIVFGGIVEIWAPSTATTTTTHHPSKQQPKIKPTLLLLLPLLGTLTSAWRLELTSTNGRKISMHGTRASGCRNIEFTPYPNVKQANFDPSAK